VDGEGNVFVADAGDHRIRKITPQGHVSTLAGTGVPGYQEGEGAVAQFHDPRGLAVDRDGNVFVADRGNHRIRKITPQGRVSTLAGTGVIGYQDGEGTVAQFKSPIGVAVDGNGNVIVADAQNHRIRKVTPQGHVITLAGTGYVGHRDGDPITTAQFSRPSGIAVDENGNVLVSDTSCIRCVASDAVTPLGLPPLPPSSFASDIQRYLIDSSSFQDVSFVVEQEFLPAHRSHLSARCEYFRSMFGAGFQKGDSAEIHIKGTSVAAFKALLRYLYTDNMDVVDAAVLFDLAKLSDHYRVDRLHNYCLRQLDSSWNQGITVQNAVMRLVQAYTADGEGSTWADKLKRTTMKFVTDNFDEIRCNELAALELLEREHPGLFNQVLKIKLCLNV
jgi:sugar lactone lactonase YvrE